MVLRHVRGAGAAAMASMRARASAINSVKAGWTCSGFTASNGIGVFTPMRGLATVT